MSETALPPHRPVRADSMEPGDVMLLPSRNTATILSVEKRSIDRRPFVILKYRYRQDDHYESSCRRRPDELVDKVMRAST